MSKAIDKRPGVGQHAAFAAHLAERRSAAGLSRADVSERVVGTRTGACWNWEHHQFPEAKWWPALRDLLDLDARWTATVAEAERAKTGERAGNLLAVAPGQGEDRSAITLDVTSAATPDAERWHGWGTALKPAHEPIVVARKPLAGTVAANVLAHGTGALNVDGCRIGWGAGGDKSADRKAKGYSDAAKKALGGVVASESDTGFTGEVVGADSSSGRWPANVVLSHSPGCREVGTRKVRTGTAVNRNRDADTMTSWLGTRPSPTGEDAGYADADGTETVPAWECEPGCAVRMLDEQTGQLTSGSGTAFVRNADTDSRASYGEFAGNKASGFYGDTGGASRFFYCPKADGSERHAGLGDKGASLFSTGSEPEANVHPTVKPIDLMRWLVRLVTPPGGTVLDPFAGSGTTGCAAVLEGFDFIGLEREPEYVAIARARIAHWSSGTAEAAA